MKDSKEIIDQLAQDLARSRTTSATPVGQSKQQGPNASTGHAVTAEHVDAINQVFALFRINYHNQYHSAFGDSQVLNQAKKLWLESLSRFNVESILQGAKRAIEQSDYLPTLHKMIGYCQGSFGHHGLPEAHQAYLEACNAPSPKANHQWSHPAVYYAGKDSDWFFLGNNPERIAFPIFKENYSSICQRIISGETLPAPEIKRLPETIETPLSKAENLKRLKELRANLKL